MQDQKVSAGLSTVSLGGVSAAAYVAAIVAFFSGARDEATIGTAVIGTVALVTMAAGRFWQAIAKTKREAIIAATAPPRLITPSGGREISLAPVPYTQVWGLDDDGPDDEAPLPDPTIYDPEIDEPGGQLTRDDHSNLSGG